MSRHYNTKHPMRTRKAPREFGKLAQIEGRTGLRAKQERRVENFGSPFPRGGESEVDE